MNTVRPRCKVCESDTLRHLYTSRRLNLPIWRCIGCGLVFVAKNFTASAQREFYGEPTSYLEFAQAERTLPEVGQRHLDWLAQIRRCINSVEVDGKRRRKPRLLDIGCGAGDFLAAATGDGFEAHGIEVSEPAAQLAREWHGIDVALRNIEDDPRDHFFDVVTAIGLLEHVTDPRALLFHARRVLVAGGVLFIYIPVWGIYDRLTSSLARVTRGRLSRLIDRRINRAHLQIFPKYTLVRALQIVGYETMVCEAVCEYNLPVKYYLQSLGVSNPRPLAIAANSLKALIDRKLFFRNNLRVVSRKL
jgi:SAM-dependent methyltransferase